MTDVISGSPAPVEHVGLEFICMM